MASQVIKLLDLVWKNANDAVDHSWERLNHAMYAALRLAIGSGFDFAVGDFKHIGGNYRSGYWIGSSDEWAYTEAIAVGNMSAIKSFESWKGREPIIAADISVSSNSGYSHGNNMNRAKERLCVGAELLWQGERVTITSFKNGYAVGCSYKDRSKYPAKIKSRYTISREAVLQERERLKLVKELLKQDRQEVIKRLKVKTQKQFDALPIDKVRKVLATFNAT